MAELLILADDLTGALDTAAQFVNQGISALVYPEEGALDFSSVKSGVQVISINAETRHLSPAEAYRHVKELTRRALAAGISQIYKKTDSALRGNVGSELQAVLDAAGGRRLFFLPAYPECGRVTVEGIQYFNGVEIARSVFGRDPFEPVRSSSVPEIIAQQSDVEVMVVERGDSLTGMLQSWRGICVIDAKDNRDIREFCRRMPMNKPALLGGCAGFAAHLANRMAGDGAGAGGRPGAGAEALQELPAAVRKIVIASGSLNPISRKQMEYITGDGLSLICVRPGCQGEAYAKAQACLKQSGIVALQTEDCDRRETGAELHGVRQSVGAEFGALVSRVAQYEEGCALVIVGGDTLCHIIKHMCTGVIVPLKTIMTGAVLSKAKSRRGEAVILVTKSGGFGEEETLGEICSYLRGHWQASVEIERKVGDKCRAE